MKKVILLDIDGVLVQHGGYRAALHATLNHFANLMGLSHFDFPEEKLAELEKRGIFSEWDMVPLLLAALWNDILSHRPTRPRSNSPPWGVTWLKTPVVPGRSNTAAPRIL